MSSSVHLRFLSNQTETRETKTKNSNTEAKKKKNEIPCSLRAVKTMVPVSSPTTHSAILVWRRWWETERPLAKTVLELMTLTVSVWPVVPGLNCSTFLNSGFLSTGFGSLGSGGGCDGSGDELAMRSISQTLTLIHRK